MIVMGSLALLRPYWLLILPVFWLFLKSTRTLDDSLGDWPRAIDPPLLNALMVKRSAIPLGTHQGDIVWTVVLIVLALSGPARREATSSQFRNLDAALIVMNASNTTNLSKVTTAAQIVLSGSGARQTGLVLYAGDAYLASPLTYDLASIEALIFAVDDQTIPDGGARPERALALARDLFRHMKIYAGDVILIGDGTGIDARTQEEARLLATEGHSLHTLFIPSNAPDDARAAASRAAMMELAGDGHGLAGDAVAAEKIAEAIAQRRIEHVVKGSRQALEWQDLGRFIILLSAIPLFLFLRKGAV